MPGKKQILTPHQRRKRAKEASISRLRRPSVKISQPKRRTLHRSQMQRQTTGQSKWQRLKSRASVLSPQVAVQKLRRSLSRTKISPTAAAAAAAAASRGSAAVIEDVEEFDDADDDDEMYALTGGRIDFDAADLDEDFDAASEFGCGAMTIRRLNAETFEEMDRLVDETLGLRFRGSKWDRGRAEVQKNMIKKLKGTLRDEVKARKNFVDRAALHEETWTKQFDFHKSTALQTRAGITAQHSSAMAQVEVLQRQLAEEKASRAIAETIAREVEARGSTSTVEASKMRLELDGLYSENRRLRAANEDLEQRMERDRARQADDEAYKTTAAQQLQQEKQASLDRAVHLEAKMTGVVAENKHMASALAKSEARVGELESSLAATRGSSHEEVTALRQSLEAERDALAATLAAERASRAAVDRELEGKREAVAKSERLLAEKEISEASSKSSSDRVQRQLDEARERVDTAQQRNMEMQTTLMERQMELMAAKQEAMLAQTEAASNARQHEEAGTKVAGLVHERDVALEESSALKRELSESRNALEAKRAESAASSQDLIRRHDRWDDERAEMKTVIATKDAVVEEKETKLVELLSEVAKLEEELEEKEASLRILRDFSAFATPRKKSVPTSPAGTAAGGAGGQQLETHGEEEEDDEAQAANDEAILQLRQELLAKQEEVERLKRTIAKLQEQLSKSANMREEMAAKDEELAIVLTERRKLHNVIQDLKGAIRVHVRVRPILAGDRARAAEASTTVEEVVQCPPGRPRITILPDPAARAAGAVLGEARAAEAKTFDFDGVFPKSASQKSVFDEMSCVVQSAVDGYHVSLMCYGQTGSGKTHTMLGNDSERSMRGLIPRAVSQLLELVEGLRTRGWTYSITSTFLEVYCEQVFDLNAKPDAARVDLKIVELNGVPTCCDAEKIEITSQSQLEALLASAQSARATSSTAMNSESSRSHSVFILHLEGKHPTEAPRGIKGSLHLVDLAGTYLRLLYLLTYVRTTVLTCLRTYLLTYLLR